MLWILLIKYFTNANTEAYLNLRFKALLSLAIDLKLYGGVIDYKDAQTPPRRLNKLK